MGHTRRRRALVVAASCLLMVVMACGGGGAQPATTVQASATTIPVAVTTSIPLVTTTTTAMPAAPTTIAPVSSTTSSAPPVGVLEPLTSYRFILGVGLTDNPGYGPVEPIRELAGETTTDPYATRIFGQIHDDPIDIVDDGQRWWDLSDPDFDLTDGDVEFLLGANGLLLAEAITDLLADEAAWESATGDRHLGLPVTRSTRLNVIKDRDWDYGDLALLEAWRDDLGQLVKFTAWFATGDQAGFPVAAWEITERNPNIEIAVPSE